MTEPAIRVRNLSKRYRLGALPTLRQRVMDVLRRNPGTSRGPSPAGASAKAAGINAPPTRGTFDALRDVSFDVAPGEVLGLIGANGAGKSTLLKILSRITAPTAGRVELRGRVGSLLEVGTGFHPELTGRENVFLNGTILGMTRAEVRARFDEIVDFAGIEAFLDTPVKRYSSGMRVRLAFAVAAHLTPEVLLIDEVLAVGDLEFQRKCLGKMNDVARQGRTVVFVSHNMAAVRSLCERCVWLDGGRVRVLDDAETVVERYTARNGRTESPGEIAAAIDALPKSDRFVMRSFEVTQNGVPTLDVGNGDPIELVMDYEVGTPTLGLRVYFDLCDEVGDILIRSFHDEHEPEVKPIMPGRYRSVARLPANLLAPRQYTMNVRASLHDSGPLIGEGIALRLHVRPTSTIDAAYPNRRTISKLQPFIPWHTEKETLACAA